MLTWIRKKSSGLLMTFIMGLLILAFAMWGVQDYFTQSSNDAVAVVNGEKISLNDYSQQFGQYRQNLMNQFGDGFDPSYFDSPMMKRNFLESMINNELFKQAASDNGYVVTAAEIRNILEDAATFKDENGQFSTELYAAFLAQTNQSSAVLEGKIIDGLVATAINDALDVTTFTTPYEQKAMAALNLQTRDFEYAVISPNNYLDEVTYTDDELLAYYEENKAQYMTAPMVAVDYIELNAEEVASGIEISDEQALSHFENNKELYVKSEQRLASHILINESDDALVKIQDIKKQLDEGADFATLAQSESQDVGSAGQGGDLGWVNPGDMVAEFDQALFAMESGSISDVVKTTFGYHLIQLNDIKLPEPPLFEEVKDDIVQALQAKEAENLFLDKASELAALVLDAEDSLDPVAEAAGLELKTTELFDRNGGEGLAANEDFKAAAFSSLVKDDLQNSDVINISDTHIVFLHLNESKEAELKAFDLVKDTVETAVKNQKAKNKADDLAATLIAQINDENLTLQNVAESNELVVVDATSVKRSGSEHPFTLVKNVFNMTLEATETPTATIENANGNDVALVILKNINDADLSSIDLSAESAQLARNIKANEQQLIIAAMREKSEVFINEELLNQSAF